jgi:hypothetical protein
MRRPSQREQGALGIEAALAAAEGIPPALAPRYPASRRSCCRHASGRKVRHRFTDSGRNQQNPVGQAILVPIGVFVLGSLCVTVVLYGRLMGVPLPGGCDVGGDDVVGVAVEVGAGPLWHTASWCADLRERRLVVHPAAAHRLTYAAVMKACLSVWGVTA